jgi:hypothetical protein
MIKPIIFSTPMVQALLNTKPNTWPAEPIDPDKPYKWMTRRVIKPQPIEVGEFLAWQQERKKYQRGDILWVRETFTKTPDGEYIYRADPIFNGMGKGDFSWSWTPSIFMPREASRLSLKVKGVRVERIQDITEENARAEGVFPGKCTGCGACSGSDCYDPIRHFENLWDTSKRGYSWDSNPYVWVYDLMRS